ncbi:MAG: hypothetical protein KGI24_08680 [Candidatus Omnitrophica bacterium]|nr:hypothetical protein [Candidatus Omnitrophota bacterium]
MEFHLSDGVYLRHQREYNFNLHLPKQRQLVIAGSLHAALHLLRQLPRVIEYQSHGMQRRDSQSMLVYVGLSAALSIFRRGVR